jgi:hypothetical protein
MQYSSLLLENKKSEQLFGGDFQILVNSFIPFNSFPRFDKQLM